MVDGNDTREVEVYHIRGGLRRGLVAAAWLGVLGPWWLVLAMGPHAGDVRGGGSPGGPSGAAMATARFRVVEDSGPVAHAEVWVPGSHTTQRTDWAGYVSVVFSSATGATARVSSPDHEPMHVPLQKGESPVIHLMRWGGAVVRVLRGGQPVSRAMVSVFDTRMRATGRWTTDGSGEVRLERVGSGVRTFSARGPEGWAAEELVVLGAGHSNAITLVLHGFDEFTGRVKDDAGRAVVGARVSVDVPWGVRFEQHATTGQAGTFSLQVPRGVRLSGHRLHVTAAGFLPAHVPVPSTGHAVVLQRGPSPAGEGVGSEPIFEQGTGSTEDLGSMAGSVTTGGGVSPMGLVVLAQGKVSGLSWWGITDDSGAFSVGGLPEDDYAVSVLSDGVQLAERMVRVSSGGSALVDMEVFRANRLEVRVLSPFGDPVAGAAVAILNGAVDSTRITGRDGVATWSFLGRPPWRLRVQTDEYPDAERTVRPHAAEHLMDVELPHATSMMGYVEDGDGRPVSAARVALGDMATRSDKNGAFQFSKVGPGVHTLRGHHEKHGEGSLEVTVPDGRHRLLEMRVGAIVLTPK